MAQAYRAPIADRAQSQCGNDEEPAKRDAAPGDGRRRLLDVLSQAECLALNVVEFLPAEEQNVDRSWYLPGTRQPARAPDRVHGEPAGPCTTGCRIRYQDLILPGTEPNHLTIQRSPITFQLSVHPRTPRKPRMGGRVVPAAVGADYPVGRERPPGRTHMPG
jgi:hypothetical protein